MAVHQTNVRVVPNALDERIWADLHPVPKLGRPSPLRILYMGTATHANDLALIEPAIRRIQEEFRSEVSFEIMGVTPEPVEWAERVTPPSSASRSYASFVNWIKAQNRWHIGVAPLEDTDFTASKSAIKALDYAGLGLAVVASDVHAYRQMIVSGETGLLVNNDVDAWFQALRSLIRRPGLRFRLAAEARSRLLTNHMLNVQPQSWLELLHFVDRSEGREESAAVRECDVTSRYLETA
jgi:glycosyltransferase involved in cell wall biosynthesis